LQHINQEGVLAPSLRQLGTLRLIGVMTLTRRLPAVVPELWQALAQQLKRAGIESATRDAYGITWFPERWQVRGLLHMAAVEASQEPPEAALVAKTLPPAKCARFIHQGSRHDLVHSLDYIHRTWLPRSGESLASTMVIERHGEGLAFAQEEDARGQWELFLPLR
jgi:predicted transcriptional regulator YdeE